MENEVLPKSLTVRGTWKQQTTGSIPDFNGIKFTVKTSDGESIRYDDWDSFNAAGGDYSINSEKVWAPEEGTQTITLFLSEYPSIKTSKDVNIIKLKQPIEIRDVVQTLLIEAGNKVSPYCHIIIKYSDGTLKEKFVNEYSVSPEFIPVTEKDSINCTFTYSENGFSISKNHKISVKPREYFIEIFPDEDSDTFIKDGMFKKTKFFYTYTSEGPIVLNLSTIPKSKGYRFDRWKCTTDALNFDYKKENTILTIPKNTGLSVTLQAVWDKYFDEFGNKYYIDDGVLKIVDIMDSRLILPEEVNVIYEFLFEGSSIESVVLPHHLSKIEKGAFRYSKIKNIEIPESVEIIEESAFEECTYLESVKFNQKKSFVIKPKAFMGCSSLSSLDFLSLGKNFKDCIFGDDNRDVWRGCALRTIKLDKSCFAAVKEIHKGNPVIGYSGNGFRLCASSNEESGSISVRYPSGKSELIELNNSSSWKGKYYVWDSSNMGKENMNKCSVSSNNDVTIWMEVLGLGHPQFNYARISLPPCKYSFADGEGAYVNNLIYPQIKFDSLSDKMFDDEVKNNKVENGILKGGSLIDGMLPVYRSEQ